ncbi:hypothetical protein AAG906_032545 [Vitis piasezkii]
MPEQLLSCTELPPKVNSFGVWKLEKGPLKYPLPLLQMQILAILAVIHTLHFVLKHLGLPMLISEIAAGLLLGGSALGNISAYSEMFLNVESQNIIGTLSIFGYTLFMFLIGVKMDMGMISNTGKKALAVGILALLGPLIVGMAVALICLKFWAKEATNLTYIAAVHSLTPFPVIACLLSELKILNSELGRLALSSAIVSDLFSLFLTIVSVVVRTREGAPWHTSVVTVVSPVVFVLVVVYILRPAMFWVVAQTPEGRAVKNVYIYAIILGLLFCGIFSDFFGQYVIFGAFIFGLAVPDGPPLGSALVEKLDSMVSLVLMPIFMATCAMRANVIDVFRKGDKETVANTFIILATLIAKIGACVAPLLYCKMPCNDALALSLIMSAKGTVNMATQSVLRDSGVVDDEIFGLMVIATTLNAAIVPFLVRKLYDPSRKYAGYQTRNIMHCKPNAELRILACVHEQEGVTSIINLLNASNPTRDNPISIYVLHLIELVGRATPIFISHDMQKRTVSNHSYSENVILALNRYQRNNGGAALTHVFTAISPHKLMHEDICTLALNKLALFMIIPFHRKWNIGGSIESDEQRIRNLNCSVLDMAPCSVGILVDRAQLGRSASQSFYIALIFLGGNDDREGLAYAKRMASGPNVNLTIAHFLPMDDENTNEWENILDDEALKDIKHSNLGFEQVNYLQRVVKDGPETALIVRSMTSQYDLIIVGRRHGVESPLTSGLTEWSEFPELGALGDLLAASDLDSNASVLVVQQQRKL